MSKRNNAQHSIYEESLMIENLHPIPYSWHFGECAAKKLRSTLATCNWLGKVLHCSGVKEGRVAEVLPSLSNNWEDKDEVVGDFYSSSSTGLRATGASSWGEKVEEGR